MKDIIKNDYIITKDNDFLGQRYETYTVEKIITYRNGETERRVRVIIPAIDGDINKIDLDKLEFKKPISSEEWEKLSPEYRKAWCNGTMTKELAEELEILRKKERVI